MARGRKAAVQTEVPVEEQIVETSVEITEQETQPVEIPVEEQVVETPAPVEEPVREEEDVPTEAESELEYDTPVEEEKIEEEEESVPETTEVVIYDKPVDSIREKEAFVQHLYGNWYGIKAKLRGKIVGISSLGYVSPIKYDRTAAINYAKKINRLRGFNEKVIVVE